jgi:uncharacterized pyridoxal phosphate-containing UPF0001 family protein
VFRSNAALASSLDRNLFKNNTPLLSMGMTGDLTQAIAAGSTCVRVGSALFRGLPEATRIALPALPSRRSTP